MFCTCGCTEPHTIKRANTADGIAVQMWSDGAITSLSGAGFQGLPVRRPKTQEAADLWRSVGWLFMGEVCLWDTADLARLYRCAERAVRLDGLPGTLRRLMAVEAPTAPFRAIWRVARADPRGVVEERHCFPPRLGPWADLVLVDHCGRAGSVGGRYEVTRRLRNHSTATDVVVEATGFRFGRLADLWTHLRSL